MLSSKQRRPLSMFAFRLLLLAVCSILLSPTTGDAAANESGLEMLDQESLEARKEEAELDKKLKEAFESAKRTLVEYNDAKSNLMAISSEIVKGKDSEDGLGSKIKEIEDMKEEVSEMKESIDKRIRDINADQILELKEKVEELRKRELQRRTKLKEKEEREEKRLEKHQRKLEAQREKAKKKREKERKKRQKKKQMMMKKKKQMKKKKRKTVVPDGAIKKDELQSLVDVQAIVKESDAILEDWCVKLVEETMASMQEELEEKVIGATSHLGELGNEVRMMAEEPDDEEEKEKEEAGDDGCSGATLVDAVHIVQEQLVKYSHDAVGMVDHLTRATVVHFLTSDNYVPPSKHDNPIEKQWWFQYLPDDWERGLDAILPFGWRGWNVAIPDYVYHTFPGLSKLAATSPPEAILTPHLYPGACWPMEGSSGKVTLRLAYPVKVKAVTLDHAPAMLFDNPDEDRKSAPKNVRVFGYPPCWIKQAGSSDYIKDAYLDEGGDSDDEDDVNYVRGLCPDGLDFDIQKPIVLHDFEYNMTGPSIQTFQIPLAEEEEHDDSEDDEEEGDSGTCSQDTGTCGGGLDGGPNDILFSSPDRSDSINEGVNAIRLQVTDNWGNADYTCIYRFRVHGDAMDPSED